MLRRVTESVVQEPEEPTDPDAGAGREREKEWDKDDLTDVDAQPPEHVSGETRKPR